ncbi:MAG: winged helix-turn-helix domain-containing protein [Verrucomicrobiia bacterium]
MNTDNINEAFDLLFDQLYESLTTIREKAAEATKTGKYDEAEKYIQKAKKIEGIRRNLKKIKEELEKILNDGKIEKPPNNGDNSHIDRTTQREFRIPILEILIKNGGSGKVRYILDELEEKMKGVLKSADFEPLKSGEIRWKNTAKWERHSMVKEGLLSDQSPVGIWEITEKGRQYYESHHNEFPLQ